MVVCLEQGADLHMAQLMPLPLTVPCFNKIQIGFIFLVPAHLGSPVKSTIKLGCVCAGVLVTYSCNPSRCTNDIQGHKMNMGWVSIISSIV